jgi:Uncharacterized protein conserved in bacteria (DUF2188)
VRIESRDFDVRPQGRGRWRVTSEGSPSVAMFVSERDAVQYAHACAQVFRPSTVRIYTDDGEVRESWNYGAFKGVRAEASSRGSAAA